MSGLGQIMKYWEWKKLKEAHRGPSGASTSTVAAHEFMNVNEVSDYATISEDGLDDMDFEEHWTLTNKRFKTTRLWTIPLAYFTSLNKNHW